MKHPNSDDLDLSHGEAYAAAWDEWADDDSSPIWDSTVFDGLTTRSGEESDRTPPR